MTALRSILLDGLFLAGAGGAVYGMALIYLPAAWITGGALAMFVAWRLDH